MCSSSNFCTPCASDGTATCGTCPAKTPYWNINMNACAQCASDSDCTAAATKCTVSIGRCDPCVSDGSATCLPYCPALTPYWNASSQICTQCSANANCISKGTYCRNGTCTTCVSDGSATCASCPAATPYWNGTACVACTQGSHCGSAPNYCTPQNTCASCAPGEVGCSACTDATKPYWSGTACSECITDSKCPNGKTCSSGTCTACPTTSLRDDQGTTRVSWSTPGCSNVFACSTTVQFGIATALSGVCKLTCDVGHALTNGACTTGCSPGFYAPNSSSPNVCTSGDWFRPKHDRSNVFVCVFYKYVRNNISECVRCVTSHRERCERVSGELYITVCSKCSRCMRMSGD